jgi:hypothetical protein
MRQLTITEVRLDEGKCSESWLREANQTAFLAVTESAASKFCCH